MNECRLYYSLCDNSELDKVKILVDKLIKSRDFVRKEFCLSHESFEGYLHPTDPSTFVVHSNVLDNSSFYRDFFRDNVLPTSVTAPKRTYLILNSALKEFGKRTKVAWREFLLMNDGRYIVDI